MNPWQELLEEINSPRLFSCLKESKYSRLWGYFGKESGLTRQEFGQFCSWARVKLGADKKGERVKAFEKAEKVNPFEKDKTDYGHAAGYYFDENKDLYIIHLKSKKRPMTIPGDMWRSMKVAYSNWDGAPSSVNELSRKFGLARTTVTELFRAMGMTHDSSPWSNEELEDTEESSLVEDLLRAKEERVLVQAERKEYRRVKKDADAFRRLDLLAARLAGRFSELAPVHNVPRLNLPKPNEPFVLVISPTDFHWGKRGENYNREVARKRLMKITERLLSRVSVGGSPEKIILALGGDGLHIDNAQSTTTHGTPQDCDGSPEDLAWSYVLLCRDYVDMVRQFAPVDLFVIPGNHDRYTATLLRAALTGWFSTAEDVVVCDSFSNRQYIKYGNSLLTFLHGDIGKVKDWPAIVAGEVPALWGQTKWRFIFTGHLHTERELPTFGNVTVYRMPSLAGNDTWHERKGYKSRKGLVGYMVSKNRGVIGQHAEPVLEED